MNTPAQERRLIEGFIAAFHRDPSDSTINKYIEDQTLKDHIGEVLAGAPNCLVPQNCNLVKEFLAAFNRDPSEEVINKYIDDQPLKEHLHEILAGMPNYQITPLFMVSEGNKVAVNALVEGEHRGMLFGVAPTYRRVKINPILIYEIKNNKIVNHWFQVDTLSLMNQLTAEPDPIES